LPSPELEKLKEHLSVCAQCAAERELCRFALGEMRQVEDLPVPRHFFVYPEEKGMSLWQAFLGLRIAYRWGTAMALGFLLVLSGFTVSQARLERSDGSVSVSFGRPPSVPKAIPGLGEREITTLRQQVLATMEERIRRERQDWVKQLNAAMARSGRQFSKPQREILLTALLSMEERVDQKITTAGAVLEAKSNQNANELYKTLQAQREQDLFGINNNLNRVVQVGTQKNRQTDAILETLIQVAELKWSNANPFSPQR
jgi:hypothetical protein